MIELGKYNTLTVNRFVDFGLYLGDNDGNEVLLPKRYLTGNEHEGDELTVFVYNDSENRPVATTEQPYATVNSFALMRVKAVNRVGAFLDWGLSAKDLLVPFREQRVDMKAGRSYIVYVYLDRATDRIVASAKLDKFLDHSKPYYYHRQKVEVLIVQQNELGYKVIVNDKHWGMIYRNETYLEINIGDRCEAFVKQVRPDGKIDLTLEKIERIRVDDLSTVILNYIKKHNGQMTITDKSSPDDIRAAFQCSKKDFKKALGQLYREHKVLITPTLITLP